MMWLKILSLILVLLSLWQLFAYLRYRPDAFSKDKLHKGIQTLGIMTLMLITFVTILVYCIKK